MRRLANIALILLLCVFAPFSRAELLDINSATVEQLDATLVGVGKTKAQAIVADREKNGKFKSIDDLERVKGIGPATIEKNRSKITVGAEAPATASQAQPTSPGASTPPANPQ